MRVKPKAELAPSVFSTTSGKMSDSYQPKRKGLCILDSGVWVESAFLSKQEIDSIDRELTIERYEPFKEMINKQSQGENHHNNNGSTKSEEKLMVKVGEYILLPRTFAIHKSKTLLSGSRFSWVDNRNRGEYRPRFSGFNIPLLEEGKRQQSAKSAMIRHLSEYQSSILSLPPGDGKTEVALACLEIDGHKGMDSIIAQHMLMDQTKHIDKLSMKRKTLAVVHADFIGKQICDRGASRFPGLKVSYMLTGDKINIDESDMVFVTIQSLTIPKYIVKCYNEIIHGKCSTCNVKGIHSTCDYVVKAGYPRELLDKFGIVIVDEVHHYASPIWRKVFEILNPTYWIGLSGTVERTNRLEHILYKWMGPISFRSIKQYSVQVEVIVCHLQLDYPQPIKRTYLRKEVNDNVGNISTLINMRERLEAVMSVLDFLSSPVMRNRQCLFLSERRDYLKVIMKLISTEEDGSYKDISTGLLVGGTKLYKQDEAKSKQWIFSTYPKSNEALDLPGLSIIVFLTPKEEIYQSTMRVVRSLTFKFPPLIIDLCDEWTCFHKRFKGRKAFYNKNGYQITHCDKNMNPMDIKGKARKSKNKVKRSTSDPTITTDRSAPDIVGYEEEPTPIKKTNPTTCDFM